MEVDPGGGDGVSPTLNGHRSGSYEGIVSW